MFITCYLVSFSCSSGVIFIDEAYSIVKEGGGRDGSGASFGKEAIDTLMKHMDPPACVSVSEMKICVLQV